MPEITASTVLTSPFVWGFALGFLFFVLSFIAHWKTKRELHRYQKHLSDKLELEARQYEQVRQEKDTLARENENLRLRIGQLTEKPDQKILRDIEVLVRAEKRMMINAPGFAAAWETAKADASRELDAEERGKSIPKRLFTRLFGNGAAGAHAGEGEPHALLESGTAESGPEPAPKRGEESGTSTAQTGSEAAAGRAPAPTSHGA